MSPTAPPPFDGAVRAFDELRRRWSGARPLPVWYHEGYRLPVHDIREAVGIEPRRADLALWGLLGAGNRHLLDVHESTRATYGELGLVHTAAYLESLTQPLSLSAVFGLHRRQFPVDAVLSTVRLAVGGTIAATRYVLAEGGPALNLLGGFHHAFPDKGAGLCPVNDLAIALAVARSNGFGGQVVVLDLDAHPPDGTAACTVDDDRVWIGSISGSDWGPLPDHVDETVLPGADDAAYVAALDALLDRAPKAELVFVLAGGDVLSGDRLGALALTPDGACRRDRHVRRWLDDTPSVWVPAGGYAERAWRVLARTAVTLVGPAAHPVPPDLDPVASRFAYVSRNLDPRDLVGTEDPETFLTQAEVDAMFGSHRQDGPPRLLGYYTAEGVEYALHAFGFLTQLRRLGYGRFHVELTPSPTGDRVQLTGEAGGERHLLWEMVVSVEKLDSERLLYLNWMTMRHPLGSFQPGQPRLPGQDVPGLGLAEEAMQLLVRVCERLGLAGILLRPAWYHTAWMSRERFRFVDPTVQGQFEALQRDLGSHPLLVVSEAVAQGRVRCNGAPWTWPAEPMVLWLGDHAEDADAVRIARESVRFTLH
ncbi:MAG: histone deacetylase [Alphaproteobacteria bacterium]|nr:histone deacetylase [Alphaproteobacteria bacterium]